VLFVLLVLTVAVNPATLMFGVLAVALIRNGALVLRPTESRRGCHGRFAFYQTADRLLGCGDERSRAPVFSAEPIRRVGPSTLVARWAAIVLDRGCRTEKR
jgi:hypothetical protein